MQSTGIEKVAAMFRVPRNSLHIVAGHKGLIAGKISFVEDGTFIDVSRFGSEVRVFSTFCDIGRERLSLHT